MDLLARTCSVCGKFALDEDDIEALTEPARINAAFAGRKSGQLADARDQLRGVVEALAELVAAQGDIGRWAAECWNCGGTGWLGARHDEDECACPQCDGAGKIEVVRASDYLALREALKAARS